MADREASIGCGFVVLVATLAIGAFLLVWWLVAPGGPLHPAAVRALDAGK